MEVSSSITTKGHPSFSALGFISLILAFVTLEQHNTRTDGYFVAKDGDRELGRMYYSWTGIDTFIINHTEVNPEAKGTGTGLFLVEGGVKYARENNLKVIPRCPFANAMFKKHKEWKDVVFE
jgi:predicted GNAT family acetyltransferase